MADLVGVAEPLEFDEVLGVGAVLDVDELVGGSVGVGTGVGAGADGLLALSGAA